ncbi:MULTISPECIES: class I SAM-dependent methyltransferase [Haloferacaceae]|uniref:Class I SAM-dependent methyltransferase n=1 Tax=Halorubrum glutamatedens TaxID=2707018 RepID=A0ABD5QUK2_9EURY|nr:methyltransferase domain-containing protein [Halobellus captivus]
MTGGDATTPYTRHAGFYDRIAADAPIVAGLRRRVVDVLDPGRGDVVVEMGCGTGANLSPLRDRVGPGGTVIGLDVSAGMLDRARGRIERAGWRNVHVARADARRSPIPTGADVDDGNERFRSIEVDAVLATFLTGMLEDPAGAVDGWCGLVADTRGGPDRSRRRSGRVCIAGLARSTRPLGRLLNPGFAGIVRAAAPSGWDDGLRDGNDQEGRGDREKRKRRAVEVLDERALAAHRRIHERCSDATTTREIAGFARVTAGTVDPS